MIRLARGARWGASRMPLKGFGAEEWARGGAGAADASRFSSPASARPPRPIAERPRKSRRFRAKSMLWQYLGMTPVRNSLRAKFAKARQERQGMIAFLLLFSWRPWRLGAPWRTS